MRLKTKKEIENIIKKCSRDYTEDNKNLIFKCVQKAQELKDPDLEYKARLKYVNQLNFLGYSEKAISIFPWLLDCCDTYPKRFNYKDALWAYKWIVNDLYEFSAISCDQIETVFDDFERRFNKYGAGQRIITYYKMSKFHRMGNPKEALLYLRASESISEKGPLDNCEACMVNGTLDLLLDMKLYAEVLEKAKPILDKTISCLYLPSGTYPKIVFTYMMLGKTELAEKYYQLTIKNSQPKNLSHKIILYLSANHRFSECFSIIGKKLNLDHESWDDVSKCHFYQSCHLFFQEMYRSGRESISIDLSSFGTNNVLPDPSHNNYQTKELAKWLKGIAYHHAKKLDLRNGNNFYEEKLDFYSEIFKKVQ